MAKQQTASLTNKGQEEESKMPKNSNGQQDANSLNGNMNNSDHSNNHIVAMEMESLNTGHQSVRQSSRQQNQSYYSSSSGGGFNVHPLTSLWMLIKMHLEYYPKISSILGITLLGFLMYLAVEASKPPLSRHKLAHDYTDIDKAYNWKAAQIDHWCLFVSNSYFFCVLLTAISVTIAASHFFSFFFFGLVLYSYL